MTPFLVLSYLLCRNATFPAVPHQPHLAKSLLQQIREAHQECLVGLEGGSTREGSTEAGGARGAGRSGGGGKGAGGGGGGEAAATAADAGGAVPSSSWLEADALALVPLFADHASTGEMNFLNKSIGAMSLTADVAGIASSIGQGGNLAGFLRDLGYTCCSSPASLRQAIRVSFCLCKCLCFGLFFFGELERG